MASDEQEVFGPSWFSIGWGIFALIGGLLGLKDGNLMGLIGLYMSLACFRMRVVVNNDKVRTMITGIWWQETPLKGYSFAEGILPFTVTAHHGMDMRPVFSRIMHRDYQRFCRTIGLDPGPFF